MFSIVAIRVCIPTNSVRVLSFLTPSPAFIVCRLFDGSHSDWCKKNTFESVLMRRMKLEPIIQSEVSQKEKHQFSILTHIYGI